MVDVAVVEPDVVADVVALEDADVVAVVDAEDVADEVAVDETELVCVVDGDVFWQACSSYKVPAMYCS